MANKCVSIFSDNAAIVEIINRQTSKHKEIMVLLRDLVLSCLKHNILFQARHIFGFINSRANYLSRFQVAKSSVVQYSNVAFLSHDSFTHMAKMTISKYKHNSNNKPFDILLASDDSPLFSPSSPLCSILSFGGIGLAPFFCHADFSPLYVHQFNKELQRCFTYCGLDTNRYKSQGFALAALVTLLIKVFLMPKYELLVAGNPMHLKSICVQR